MAANGHWFSFVTVQLHSDVGDLGLGEAAQARVGEAAAGARHRVVQW